VVVYLCAVNTANRYQLHTEVMCVGLCGSTMLLDATRYVENDVDQVAFRASFSSAPEARWYRYR